MWIPLRLIDSEGLYKGKLLCYFLKHQETKLVKNLGIWQILELYLYIKSPPGSADGTLGNWQKPAKGECFPDTPLLIVPKKKFKQFCTFYGDAS